MLFSRIEYVSASCYNFVIFHGLDSQTNGNLRRDAAEILGEGGNAIVNAFLLMIPLFLIRFGLLGIINKSALNRAAFFAPLEGGERVAYFFYQVSNAFLIFYPIFLKIQIKWQEFFIGLFIYILGIVVLVISTVAFAKPNQSGLNATGIYKVSRNPMYIGYFIYFLGCAILLHSMLLFIALLILQISTHWIILSEERWCINKFGSEYVNYMDKVKRYF